MADVRCFNTIRLSEGEVEALLLSLEREQPSGFKGSKRRTRRWFTRGRKVILTTNHAAGNARHFAAYARNLSASGMSVLHGGFLHNGSRCVVAIRDTTGKARLMKARVTRCQHLNRHLHDLGLQFEESINPRDFIDFGDEHVFTVESVEVGDLRGLMLVIEDSQMFLRLFRSFVGGAALEMKCVGSCDEGLSRLADNPSMIFVDLHLPGRSGLEFIAEARARFYEGPIILMTGDTSPGLRAKALRSGATEMLTKPFPPEELHRAIAEFLLREQDRDESPERRPAVVSPDSPREIAELFVRLAAEQADALEKALAANDIAVAKESIRQLRSSAEGCGFARLGELALEANRSLDASMSVAESAEELRRLAAWCRRATAADSTALGGTKGR